MSSQAVSEFRRRRKLNLVQVCGNKCNICGYDRVISALEFHHIKAETKTVGLGKNGTCRNFEVDLNEVKKCILVCANCHREIHSGLFSEEELEHRRVFNEHIANQLLQSYNSAVCPTPHFCKECGIKIGSQSEYCPTCAHKQQRVIKERPSREELKSLIQNYNFTELSRQFGITGNAIRKWCKAENLPFRKRDIWQITEWADI